MPIPPNTTWLGFFDVDGLDNRIGTVGAESATLIGSALTGGVVVHDATTDRTELTDDVRVLIGTTAVTIALGYRKRDTTLRASGAFGVNNGVNTERCGVHLPYASGIVHWDFGGASEDVSRESVAWTPDTSLHTWAFTAGARGMEIWRDGVKVSSNAATPTRTESLAAYHLGFHLTFASDLADYAWFFINTTQLSEALIEDILNDPEGALGVAPAVRSMAAFWLGGAAMVPAPAFKSAWAREANIGVGYDHAGVG